MRVKKIRSSFAAEITGLDLSRKISKSAFRDILNALHKYGVICIRGQRLSPKAYVKFASNFGTPENFPPHPSYPNHPEIFPVANFPEGGHIYEGKTWHTDSITEEKPAPMTLFYSHTLPTRGGETLFINTHHLYQNLSSRLLKSIQNLDVVYRSGDIHQIVRRHPYTQEDCLFLHFGLAYGIRKMDLEKGKRLLKTLEKKYINCTSVYAHRYKPGDLIIWDNVKVAHKAGKTPPDLKRIMLRITISGE